MSVKASYHAKILCRLKWALTKIKALESAVRHSLNSGQCSCSYIWQDNGRTVWLIDISFYRSFTWLLFDSFPIVEFDRDNLWMIQVIIYSSEIIRCNKWMELFSKQLSNFKSNLPSATNCVLTNLDVCLTVLKTFLLSRTENISVYTPIIIMKYINTKCWDEIQKLF